MSQHGQVRFPRRATETGWWHSPGERYPAHTLTPWWRGERSGRRTCAPHAPRMPSGEWEFGNKQLIGRAIWTLFWQPVYLTVTPQPLGKFNYSDDKGAQLWFTTSGLWRCVQWPPQDSFWGEWCQDKIQQTNGLRYQWQDFCKNLLKAETFFANLRSIPSVDLTCCTQL